MFVELVLALVLVPALVLPVALLKSELEVLEEEFVFLLFWAVVAPTDSFESAWVVCVAIQGGCSGRASNSEAGISGRRRWEKRPIEWRDNDLATRTTCDAMRCDATRHCDYRAEGPRLRNLSTAWLTKVPGGRQSCKASA